LRNAKIKPLSHNAAKIANQRAFGRGVTVGIISIQNPDYDPKHWWRYSEGVRDVLGESIAYVYAKFLFHQPADEALKPEMKN
jgi:hypothetical protein